MILCLTVICMLFAAAAANAAAFDQVMQRWTQHRKFVDNYDGTNLEIFVTYYSAEYIEAYVQSQAQKNMWTQNETDDYKYKFLGALQLNETIPVQIKFINNGPSMYLGPFDIMVKLRIGNNLYKPVDYDKRFNFKLQGEREGLVYFPRYDKKTGKDLLKGAKNISIEISSAVSPILNGKEQKFFWNVANDDPQKLYVGKTTARLETDRLLKRLEKIRADKAGLQKQIDAIDSEEKTIQARLDELAKQ